jgi:cell division protein FtsN
VGEPRTACGLLDSASAEAAHDVEFTNQVLFYRGRCTAAAMTAHQAPAAVAPPVLPAAPTQPPPAAPAGTQAGWMVQVFASRARADAEAVVRRLAAAGLMGDVTASDDGYHRVRLGPFAAEAQAREAASSARRVVGGSPFLVRPQ